MFGVQGRADRTYTWLRLMQFDFVCAEGLVERLVGLRNLKIWAETSAASEKVHESLGKGPRPRMDSRH